MGYTYLKFLFTTWKIQDYFSPKGAALIILFSNVIYRFVCVTLFMFAKLSAIILDGYKSIIVHFFSEAFLFFP